jgi:hypothetical protein
MRSEEMDIEQLHGGRIPAPVQLGRIETHAGHSRRDPAGCEQDEQHDAGVLENRPPESAAARAASMSWSGAPYRRMVGHCLGGLGQRFRHAPILSQGDGQACLTTS